MRKITEGTTTHRRDWMKEAFMIFKGADIPVKKEHVKVVMENFLALQTETKKLRDVMTRAYNEACKRRKEKGEPVPLFPQSLNPPPTPTQKKETKQ